VSAAKQPIPCELCGCEAAVSFHHLIPRTLHANKWFKKNFTREQMHAGLELCKQCHSAIHDFVDEKQLGRHFHSRELLAAHPEIAKYLAWKRKRR
jgi:hypothetical protein